MGELGELPVALMRPEIRVVDGDDLRGQALEAQRGALEQDEEGDGAAGDRDGRGEQREHAVAVVRGERRAPEHDGGEERREAAHEPERAGDEIMDVLGADARAAGRLVDRGIHVAVALDHARDFERGRAEQADILAHRTVDRDHGLGAEQALRAGAAIRRIEDVVAEIIVLADLRFAQLERRRRGVHVDHRQAVGDHRAGADIAQERIVVALVGAHVRAGLLDRVQLPADIAHVIHDERRVAEQHAEEFVVRYAQDDALQQVMDAEGRIGDAFLQEHHAQARHGIDRAERGHDRQREPGGGHAEQRRAPRSRTPRRRRRNKLPRHNTAMIGAGTATRIKAASSSVE